MPDIDIYWRTLKLLYGKTSANLNVRFLLTPKVTVPEWALAFTPISALDQPMSPRVWVVTKRFAVTKKKMTCEVLHIHCPLFMTIDILIRENIYIHKDTSSPHDAKTALQ